MSEFNIRDNLRVKGLSSNNDRIVKLDSTGKLITSDFTDSQVSELSGNFVELEREMYDAYYTTGLVKDSLPSVSFDEGTRTVTIGACNFYIRGEKFSYAGGSVVLDNVTQANFIYFNSSGVLTTSTTAWDLKSTSPITLILWNATLGEGKQLEERHTSTKNPIDHEYEHLTYGARLQDGFAISDYILDDEINVNYQVASGSFWDEDITNEVPSISGAQYSVFYRDGATEWRWSDTETLPFFIGVGGAISYNENVGGSYQLTELGNVTTEFVNYYVVATNIINGDDGIIQIPGQAVYTSIESAQAETVGDVDFGNLADLLPEVVFLYKITYRTKNNITGAEIANVENIQGSNLVNVQTGVTAHNALIGLQGGTSEEYYHWTESDYNDRILKTEVANISGDLQTQIDNISGGGGGSGFTPLEGTGMTITSSGDDYVFAVEDYISKTEVAEISGNVYQGLEPCDTTNDTYTISHSLIDENYVFPHVNLEVPTSGDVMFTTSVTNRTSTSFDVVLSGTPATSGYFINWILVEGVGGGQETLTVTENVVAEHEVTTAEQTISFDVPSSSQYQIRIDGINDAGSITNIYTYINDDTTDSNYHYNLVVASNGGSIVGAEGSGPYMGSMTPGEPAKFIYDVSINPSGAMCHGVVTRDQSNADALQQLFGSWYYDGATPSSITKITLSSNIADGFGVGTKIKIIDPTKATLINKVKYSTDEKAIGETWIDNKAIYRKVVSLGTLPNATFKDVAHGITGLDTLISISGNAYRSDTGTRISLPFADPTSGESISLYWIDNTNLRVVTGTTDRTAYTESYAILEYTKV